MATGFRLLGAEDIDPLLFQLRRWHQDESLRFDPIGSTAGIGRILREAELGHIWMIEKGSDAIGYMVLTFQNALGTHEPRAYVSALYLIPSHRGLGIGRQAIRLMEDVGHLLRVRIHHFDTESERKHAPFIYRRAGTLAVVGNAGYREAVR